jgi:class 3 adenylate cyclase/tetratricopeptide (TPR) repeat protein
MRCRNCSAENPEWANFCFNCGKPLEQSCSNCGAPRLPQARFCARCGQPFPAAPGDAAGAPAARVASPDSQILPAPVSVPEPSLPEGERRQITVMFCDIVGSTALSTQLDPEELRDVVRAYQDACAAVIARYDGFIAQYLGDGIVVYFGYPTAHEDDAQRGARAGLGVVEAVQKLSPRVEQQYGVRLDVRVGLHTGLVVVGEIGSEGRREQLALGETLNVTARLQEQAAPNSAVMSVATYRLVAGFFECRELGFRTLKGIAEPVLIYEVLHESAARSRLDVAAASGLTPLAGRDAEVSIVTARWEQAKEGNGHVILIGGEPGIGKSRLVRVLEEHIVQDPRAWLTVCLASPYHQDTAFYPIIDLLERVVLQFTREDSNSHKLRKLEGWLVEYGVSLSEGVPLFAGLLSIPVSDSYEPSSLPPERQKHRMMELLVQILLTRAAEQPVVFVMEDLHWADASTLELLDRLVVSTPAERLLVVLTYRPQFVPPASWTGHTYVTQLTLSRLPHAATAEIVAAVAGDTRLPPEVLEQVIAKTDGVPLFVEELTKMVIESGLASDVDASASAAGAFPALAIPATLQDSLMARLDRLSTVKVVAQIAAAIGREFSYELLQVVCGLDDDLLEDSLEQLVAAEFLYQRGRPPDATYIFKHALIQDAAYQALLRSSRRQYHLRIARALIDHFPQTVESRPELVAHHFTQAGLAAEAVPHWQRAGERAMGSFANLEAIAHLSRALELLTTLEEREERDRQELELQVALAPAYMAIKGWASQEVERTTRRARDLSRKLGNEQHLYTALWGLWTSYFLRGQLREALEAAEQVIGMAAATDAPMLHVTARHAVGYSHFYRGEFVTTREYAEEGVRLFDMEMEREFVRTFQFSPSAALRIMLGCSLWMLGYPDQGPPLVDSAVTLTRELGHPPSEAFALAASQLMHYARRDFSTALETSEQLLLLAREEHFEIWTPFALMFRGWAFVEQGRIEEGIEETKRGLAMWQGTGTYLNQTVAMVMLGEFLWRAGRIDEALTTLDSEIGDSAKRQELLFAPELHRIRGDILVERALSGDGPRDSVLDEAEASLRAALELARSQGARMLELRALLSLTRLWRQTGRAEESGRVLSELYGSFTEGFSTPDLRAARALLDQIGSPV